MKISIIPDDDVVVIDNEAILGVNTGVANDIHAIQWLDNSGHIEYKDKRVINVTELPIPDIVDKFNARKAELVAKLAEEIAERQVVS
jgi:hypothetical protein|tara:strand:- start:34 stop:294 length:261 start_codon:yes stop_codon:yes gene_type:complete